MAKEASRTSQDNLTERREHTPARIQAASWRCATRLPTLKISAPT